MTVAGTYVGLGRRIGLFRNQLADRLLDEGDLVVTVDYYPVKHEPALWNHGRKRPVAHIDCSAPDVDRDYRPQSS